MTRSASTTPRPLAGLDDAQRAAAMRRWAVLRPHVEDSVQLTVAAREAGVPLRTAQRWLARYRADGLVGLARTTREGKINSGDALWPTDRNAGAAPVQAVETLEP